MALLGDLLIGVTALSLGFGVAMLNGSHFALIPELQIVAFYANAKGFCRVFLSFGGPSGKP